MGFLQSFKDTLDWGKRIQFLFQMVALLLSGSIVAVAHAALTTWTHVPAPWRISIYFAVAGISLFGFGMLLRRLAPARDVKDAEARIVLEGVMVKGADAALYDYMWARSKELLRDLEEVWHAWDNAGEKLIVPLDGKRNTVRNQTTENTIRLVNMQRDFMVLYGHHLMTVKVYYPDFMSPVVEMGYPSNEGYAAVRRGLVEHADNLERLSKKAWETYGHPFDAKR